MNNSFKDGYQLILKVEQYLESKLNNNTDFNNEINTSASVTIAEDGPKVTISSLTEPETKFSYDISEILYWVERDTYFDELSKWNGIKLEEKHQQAMAHLRDSNQFSSFLDLVDVIKRQRIAPFIGAGACLPAGYPSWGQALQNLANQMGGTTPAEVKDDLDSYQYLRVAEVLYEKNEYIFQNFVQTEFRLKPNHEDTKSVFPPIIELLPALAKSCIVTTNFDCLIEKCFERYTGKPLDGHMYGKQAHNGFVSRLLKGEHCLMKLHGDSEQAQSYVFTDSQYKEAYGDGEIDFTKQLPRSLRQIYISYSLLFIGCSLEQDRTLELFKSVKDEGHFEIPTHFALLANCNPEDKAEKMGRLLSMNIKPIWYPAPNGDHSLLEKIVHLAIDSASNKFSIGRTA